jgi:hypothetical protein
MYHEVMLAGVNVDIIALQETRSEKFLGNTQNTWLPKNNM